MASPDGTGDGDRESFPQQDVAQNDPQPRDFASTSTPAVITGTTGQSPSAEAHAASRPHVHYNLSIDTGVGQSTGLSPVHGPNHGVVRSDTELHNRFGAGLSPITPMIRRRTTRVGTFRTVEHFDDLDGRPGWRPGAEPGVDPAKPDGGHASMPQLSAECDITVVDFSEDDMSLHHLQNETLIAFLKIPQPNWVKCRWINVNGLSWDVIQALGKYKKLHRLAIEDIMNTRNRTKAEWYPTHAFFILTLQKLVHLVDPNDSDYDSDNDTRSWRSGVSGRSHLGFFKRMRSMIRSSKNQQHPGPTLENGDDKLPQHIEPNGVRSQPTGFSDVPDPTMLRTLQRYHASPNDLRTAYMEENSALAYKNFAVTAEQVSIFITHDNTIISFFELSAEEVETPILKRLNTRDTILRHSCDASMVGQAIVDAIIDLAIPVTTCYNDTIGDLELDVLTRPALDHTKKLYILISEINKSLSFMNPIVNLISAVRDHKTDLPQEAAAKDLQNPNTGVIITPMTHIYLGDVLDHCVLIVETLNQIKESADGLIGLIFNTVSAYQNQSMSQLTAITIIFLPLTFLTGYFGQNFMPFDVLNYDVQYFWKIAVPLVIGTIILLMSQVMWEYVKSYVQRRAITRFRQVKRSLKKKRR